jgi:hypothetical protein
MLALHLHGLKIKHFKFFFQVISLGPSDAVLDHQLAVVPDATVQLRISGCRQVEMLSKSINAIPTLQNITFSNIQSVILHSRLYEARSGNGQSATISNFDIENVSNKTERRSVA